MIRKGVLVEMEVMVVIVSGVGDGILRRVAAGIGSGDADGFPSGFLLPPEEGEASLLLNGWRDIHQQVRCWSGIWSEEVQFFVAFCFDHLILPGDGNTSAIEFPVKIVIRVIQIDSFYGRKLLNVQHIFRIHGVGL